MTASLLTEIMKCHKWLARIVVIEKDEEQTESKH
jgi:hypothetical protein